MKTTNASNARKTFARLLESVIDDEQPIVIVRYREPLAAIVPISRLQPAERAVLNSELPTHSRLCSRLTGAPSGDSKSPEC